MKAQENAATSASESMRQAGHDTANAAENADEGTKTILQYTKITAKVKVALHHNEMAKDSDIEVHTVTGVVTLTGGVPSERVASQAEQLADNTEGVKQVDNQLQVVAASH